MIMRSTPKERYAEMCQLPHYRISIKKQTHPVHHIFFQAAHIIVPIPQQLLIIKRLFERKPQYTKILR